MTQQKAPVVLFIYKRPEHTQKTIQSLAANHGAAETELIIFADAGRGQGDHDAVAATRQVAAAASGFKSVELIERAENFGLARNIEAGVSAVMDRYGRAIVLEDDIETSAGFLDYMNAALSQYQDEPRVWHISGWNYDIDPVGLPDQFFWPVMNCWGWASWADRWQHFNRNPERLAREWTQAQRHAFNLDGAHDFFEQVEDNVSGHIHTWAVFWYATIFEADGLCLNPTTSFVRNIGLDGSGEHCPPGAEEILDLTKEFQNNLPDRIEIDAEAVARIKAQLAVPLHRRLTRRIKRYLRKP